jgi:aminoglycoside phosphotransferase (APT) family kinase protein
MVDSGVTITALDRIVGLLDEHAPTSSSPTGVLTHGDLHIRHLLVDDAGQLAGVIDWGDVCVADPVVDLSVAYLAFADGSRAALIDAYGPVTAEQEHRARVLAVSLAAALADQAAHDRVDWLREAALAALARAVS